ncbi:MAG: 6-carboxytetrahydropterin synthase [Burkholderiales bacterium]|jgi:6-pyruvoyltetrahydropterin/6-carboxytetrahydropterin synthase|nr:6-carboxytetrahydropterin synthase [Burkholderiales bacterium]MCA3154597.1 6-carboxytetrahydropterin synthase [Burkholderiales bacterium]MCA3155930.1 6-carboxytetrahydropterin synthase [Burkholderiales bacterium]MCA3167425.1 6-carboxytetrahydropterin synthase [Burkholderiales bacterium]
MHQLSKSFIFEAAHTLRRDIETESSRRIHGHSYRAKVTLRGEPDAQGMLLDLGHFTQALEQVRQKLDHHFLDDIPGLPPATLERLCSYIWHELQGKLTGLYQVEVSRDMTGDSAVYRLD